MKKLCGLSMLLILALLATIPALAEDAPFILPIGDGDLAEAAEAGIPEVTEDMLTVEEADAAVANAPEAQPNGPSDFQITNGVLVKYNGNDENVVIPDGVKRIGAKAFGEKGISSVVIPEGVTRIGEQAFWWCTNLKSVTLPSSLKEIGKQAFYSCHSLKSVALPAGLTKLGEEAFEFCETLKSVRVPGSVGTIPFCAFSHCFKLKSVVIEEGVTDIGAAAFDLCYALTSVKLPKGLKTLDWGVFGSDAALTAINLPSTLESIGWGAFEGCESLTGITALPRKLRSIGEGAFKGCHGLTQLTLPAKLEEIYPNAFKECVGLTRVDVPATVRYVAEDAFSDCDGLTVYGYTNSVAEASARACGVDFVSVGVVPESVSLDTPNGAQVPVNGKLTLVATITPANAEDGLTWWVDNPDIAKVSSKGVLTPKGQGYVTVNVQTVNGKTADLQVYIAPPEAKKVKLSPSGTITVALNQPLELEAIVTPADAVANFTWSAQRQDIIDVSGWGTNYLSVVPSAKGTTKITVTTDNGKKATVKVKVVAPLPDDIEIVVGSQGIVSLDMLKGQTTKAKAVLWPKGSKSNLTWKSNKPSVAKVSSDGQITALKKGTATITVEADNGVDEQLKVTVYDEAPKPKDIEIEDVTGPGLVEIKAGESLKLKTVLVPSIASTSLTWSSSKPKVVKVSKTGKITALKKGTSIIIVETDNDKCATIKVKVK